MLRIENHLCSHAADLALLKIELEKAVESLTEALRDEDWEVRLYAAEALERIGSPGASEAVEE